MNKKETMPSTKDILKKYSAKLESQVNTYDKDYSKEYEKFKDELSHTPSRYERWANTLGNLLPIKPAEKDRLKLQKDIDSAHLEVTPSQALGLAVISSLLFFFVTMAISISILLIYQRLEFLLILLGMIASAFIFYYTFNLPKRIANSWRLKASSQMVPAVLYVVVYMKHTSNLERAIAFAADHLEGPLALDFKKVFYDLEIGKFQTIKQSLDNYLETWNDYAPEFVESFHLIESSLFEPSDSRRIDILEKSLQVILDGVYEKMLKYTREIRSPLTNIYMLGIILPTLGLALLPLASALLGGAINWQHFLVLFNIIIPFFIFYLSSEVLLKRPGGYGESSVLELNPEYYKFKSNLPWMLAFLVVLPFFIIGISPFLFQLDFFSSTFNLAKDYTLGELGISTADSMKLFDFKEVGNSLRGPFSPIAALLSLFIPLAIALLISIAYSMKTKDLIKSRDKTKKLEEEFTSSLFMLGNRIGDGTPAEIAFGKVAESTRGQDTAQFFSIVNQNIQQLGMSLEAAIFDKKRGALTYYPSSLISTSMKILTESVKKGLQVAARSLMSISEYVKNIQKINQRLKDLLAEIVSDMRSNMSFLAPLLAGIVVGLSAMITFILTKLDLIKDLVGNQEIAGLGNLADITNIFNVSEIVPPYFLQIIVGIYMIEIIFILNKTLVVIDSGEDKLKEKYDLSKNLRRGFILYVITAAISTIALSLLAAIALSGIGT